MPITFYKITSTEPVVAYLANTISDHLNAGENVLWLVPGGSSIPLAAEVSKRLQGQPLERLMVSLTDERFGPVGHPDSNWKQLEDAGFSLPGAVMYPVLTGETDMGATVSQFSNTLDAAFEVASYAIGFFGIGPDGHIAGVLPNSPGTSPLDELAVGYQAGPYQRVSATLEAVSLLDEAVVYAVGEAKHPIFDQLETELPLSTQPAQVLKDVTKARIYNDYKGEAV